MPKYSIKHRVASCIMLLCIIGSFSFSACKKGENDPFLSLRSRKARLTGDWKLKSGTESFDINGVQINIEYTESSKTINGNEYPYSESLSFDKKGEFEWIFNDNNATIKEEGSWEFGRRNKTQDYKSKETANLFISDRNTEGGETSESEYFGGDFILLDGHNNLKTIRLDELRNKKLVIIAKGSHNTGGENFEYELRKEYKQ